MTISLHSKESHGGANVSPVNYICTLSSCCIYSLSHNWDQLGIHHWCLTMMRAIYLPPSQVPCNIEDAAKALMVAIPAQKKSWQRHPKGHCQHSLWPITFYFDYTAYDATLTAPASIPRMFFFICTSTLLTLCTAFLSKFMRALIGGAECRAMLQCPERCLDCPN